MYKVEISQTAHDRMEAFLIYRANNCIYRDTGLYNESLIISNYLEDNNLFIRDLRKEIFRRLKDGLGGLLIDSKGDISYFKQIFNLRSYTIILEYNTDKNKKLTLVTNIVIKS